MKGSPCSIPLHTNQQLKHICICIIWNTQICVYLCIPVGRYFLTNSLWNIQNKIWIYSEDTSYTGKSLSLSSASPLSISLSFSISSLLIPQGLKWYWFVVLVTETEYLFSLFFQPVYFVFSLSIFSFQYRYLIFLVDYP